MLLCICRKLFLSQVNQLFFFSVDHWAAQQTVGFELPEPPTPPSPPHPPTANCCHHSSAALQSNSFRSCLYVKILSFKRSPPSLIEHYCEMKNRPRSADEWFGPVEMTSHTRFVVQLNGIERNHCKETKQWCSAGQDIKMFLFQKEKVFVKVM